jgi:uncharacterized lipoprotein NlpE involved in copper resistance
MKRSIIISALAVLLLLTGCGKKAESPSDVARKFFDAVEKNDAKKLGEYATPDTATLFLTYGEKGKQYIVAKGKIQTVEEIIDEDTAEVTVTFENGEETLDMIKVDGKWKVNISK